MIYFLLPNVYIDTYKNLDCIYSEHTSQPNISQSLCHYLMEMKYKIGIYEKEWDNMKKYTNPFEYINTIPPQKQKCISKYKPLSRSYYKMIEIIQTFSLLDFRGPISTFHLAEGPGGFIEALVNRRKNSEDSYTGITLLDDEYDVNIPAWKKSEAFLKLNPNVKIENGEDGTGDILSLANFDFCVKKYGSSMEIITADGGFDFSMDFNNQEQNMTKLLFAQICFAICMQKKGGNFVLKVFDCFMQNTIDMIYLLSSFYGTTYLTKPQTSRYANSEKYIVCKNFLHSSNKDFLSQIRDNYIRIMDCETNIIRLLNDDVSSIFITKMEEYNAIFGQQQIDSIYKTLSLIENKKTDKIDSLVKHNIQKSINWCIKHNIPYNIFNADESRKPPSEEKELALI